jgi:hypothetical protein
VGLADHALFTPVIWLQHFGRWAHVNTMRYSAEANPVGAVGAVGVILQ